MEFLEIIKAIIYGIVEGITEWLPVSSTGHMIILEDFLPMNVSQDFWNLFLVVIQLGAIMAVAIIFWNKIFPFNFKPNDKQGFIKKDIMRVWYKILIACIPAAIVGILFDDFLETYLYNSIVVAIMLITFGIGFILVENKNARENKKESDLVTNINNLTYKKAFIIGLFQLIAAIFPGTSRSGATILGSLMIGINRTVAAEFTFFLAIPVMFGASLLKILKFGLVFTLSEIILLLVGLITAFVVSIIVIKLLMEYIKKHDFKVFGWYRIILGTIVLIYFGIKMI